MWSPHYIGSRSRATVPGLEVLQKAQVPKTAFPKETRRPHSIEASSPRASPAHVTALTCPPASAASLMRTCHQLTCGDTRSPRSNATASQTSGPARSLAASQQPPRFTHGPRGALCFRYQRHASHSRVEGFGKSGLFRRIRHIGLMATALDTKPRVEDTQWAYRRGNFACSLRSASSHVVCASPSC
jgi:hypothetical protein